MFESNNATASNSSGVRALVVAQQQSLEQISRYGTDTQVIYSTNLDNRVNG